MFRRMRSLAFVPALFFIGACHRAQGPIARLDAEMSECYPANQPGAVV